jgi:hypothetical protein
VDRVEEDGPAALAEAAAAAVAAPATSAGRCRGPFWPQAAMNASIASDVSTRVRVGLQG